MINLAMKNEKQKLKNYSQFSSYLLILNNIKPCLLKVCGTDVLKWIIIQLEPNVA